MHQGEAPGGFEPPIRVLQTPALPLGYGAISAVATQSLPQRASVRLAGVLVNREREHDPEGEPDR